MSWWARQQRLELLLKILQWVLGLLIRLTFIHDHNTNHYSLLISTDTSKQPSLHVITFSFSLPRPITDRTPKTSSPKILWWYPYWSSITRLSIQHVTSIHIDSVSNSTCQRAVPLNMDYWLIGLTPLSLTDYDTYDTRPRYSRPFPGLDMYISIASITVKP